MLTVTLSLRQRHTEKPLGFNNLQFVAKQAGTGPSRRHIQGSKIAKGHQSFKVFSSAVLKFFLIKSHNAEKKLKGGPFGIFLYPVSRKTQNKLKGGPFGEKFFPEKKSCNAEKTVCYAGNFLVLFPGPTGEI